MEIDQAADNPPGRAGLGVAVKRAVVAFDDGQAAARRQHPLEFQEHVFRMGKVLEHETDEDVLEMIVGIGQVGTIGLFEMHIPDGQRVEARFGRRQRGRRDIHGRDEGIGAAARQDGGLGARTAAGLQHPAAGRIAGIVVEKVFKGAGLVVQPTGFHRVIAMYVG